MNRSWLIAFGTISILAGCKKLETAAIHDVAWYAAHAEERKQTLEACRNDPGELSKTPNCVNAQAADDDGSLGSKNGSVPHI